MLKKIIIIGSFFLLWIFNFNYIEAENKKEILLKQEKIKNNNIKILNNKLDKLILKINKKSNIEKKEFYKRLLIKLEKYNNKIWNKKYLLDIIINRFTEELNKIKIKKISFNKSKTLILKFTNNDILNKKIIENNKNNIKNNISVFIFRKNYNLKNNIIKNISKKIKNINPEILLFIDQEWGLINRYIDFENKISVDKYFLLNNKFNFLETRLNSLSKKNINIIRNIFPKKYWYFPSLEKIWKTYDIFENKNDKKLFLEIIAFIRLQSLKESWINTYWLVLDLNRWNPVISWNKRSFSKHLWKYKELVDSFIKAWKSTEIILYAKHFPGHWDWKIDSHKWILNLWKKSEYLKENLELFNYFLENSWELQTGVMVAHIYLSSDLKQKFNNIIKKADFILTDDLAMMWYKKASWNKINNLFFSTDEIINKNNLIIVDTVNISKIK